MRLSELVNKNYNSLNQNDILIWQYVSQNKQICSKMTIEELARKCNVSRATISRFTQKLSLNGFSEFKVLLKLELADVPDFQGESVQTVCDGYIHAIEDLSKKDFTSACRLMYESNRIFVCGSGDIQRKVAQQLKRIFFHGGICLYDFDGLSVNDSFFSIARPDDLVIMISLSGESERIIQLAQRMKLHDVKVLSITKLHQNSLARLSDENIYISTTQVPVDSNYVDFEVTAIFYILVEILFIRFSIYKKQRMLGEDN